MSQREKQLALVVGALLVIVLGFVGYTYYAGKVSALRTRQFTLESKISDQETQVLQGDHAFQTLKQFREHSLPADAEVARSQYKAWLLDLAEKEIKLADPLVTAGTISRSGDRPYQRIALVVSGKGTLEQLTDLLYRFYAVDFTHQIRTLDIKPIEKSRQLEIFVGIDAIVVDGAKESESLSPQPSAMADERPLETYTQTILNRNLFGPANRAPTLSSVSTQRAYEGESLSVTLKATDQDELDRVSFHLAEESPEGSSLDSSGKLRFKASEIGSYSITAIASDDGLPPMSAKTTVRVEISKRPAVVVRPTPPAPKPKPYFEDAEFAFVTAIIEVNGQRELWLNVRTSGETMRLGEGDRFEVKRLKGIVSRIGAKDVDVTAAGESRRFELGENLAEGEMLPATASGASGEGE